MLDVVQNDELCKTWSRKMAPPLVTLLSAEPEVQYVALRNVNLIVQKRPSILANEVKVRCAASANGAACVCGGGGGGDGAPGLTTASKRGTAVNRGSGLLRSKCMWNT